MSSQYIALYRKYRPAVFADVIGQDHITKVLRSEVMQNSVSHAYLFCGSRGTGKTTCAKILAKAVSCENPIGGDPCGKCDKCLAFEHSLDITEMDAASNNSVNDIRELRERVSFMPIELKRRVYIIDEVHMLSNSAFNALLKTLEEPPAHVMFILATTELNKIPATILSRCKRFDFHRISPDDMMPRLRTISDSESIGIDDAALRLVARLATGAMRDALSMLELFVGQTNIDREKASSMLGVIGNAAVLRLLEYISQKDCEKALECIAYAYKNSKDMSVLCSELSEMFRNLLVMKYASSSVSSLIDEGDDVIAVLRSIEDSFSPERLLYCTEVIEDTQNKLSKNALSRKTLLEIMIMRLCDSKLSVSLESLLERISALESGAISAPPRKANSVGSSFFAANQSSAPSANIKEDTSISSDSYIDDGLVPPPESTDYINGFDISTGSDSSSLRPALHHNEDAEASSFTDIQNSANSGPTEEAKAKQPIPKEKPFAAYAEVLEEIKSQNVMLYSLISSSRGALSGDNAILYVSSIAKFMINSDTALNSLIANICSSKLGYEVSLVLKDLPAGEENSLSDLDL